MKASPSIEYYSEVSEEGEEEMEEAQEEQAEEDVRGDTTINDNNDEVQNDEEPVAATNNDDYEAGDGTGGTSQIIVKTDVLTQPIENKVMTENLENQSFNTLTDKNSAI